jgi:hypothetical protein
MSDPPDRDDELPEAPATEEERAGAAQLREALDDPRRASDDAELARALSSAWSPRDLSPEVHRALIQEALLFHGRHRRRSRVVRLSFAASATVAIAAAVLLLVRSDGGRETVQVETTVAVSRSTQGLFPDRFAPAGGESARIDRIAMARAADLRENEFARWGVR